MCLRCLPLLLIFALCSWIETAAADEFWYAVAATCDPQQQTATFKLEFHINEEETSAFHGALKPNADTTASQSFRLTGNVGPAECHLTPEILIRAKVGEGAPAYGQCGGNPPVWLSLWIDRRKWLSRLNVGGHCADTVLKEIRVTPEGMRVCIGPELAKNVSNEADICEEHKAAELAQAIDAQEFPLDSDSPAEGTIVLDYAEDAGFCRNMIAPDVNKFGLAYWHVRPPKPLDRTLELWPKDGDDYTRNHFDIDNDGRDEMVYGYHPLSRVGESDTYFSAPARDADLAAPKRAWELALTSPYVFPSRFRTCDGKVCGAEQAYNDGELELRHARNMDKALKLSLSFVHATPFIWHGTTYFTISSALDAENLAVLRPHPTGFDEVCVFRRIPQNF